MRNPNYNYQQNPEPIGGWNIIYADMIVWGKTQPAARSRLLRVLKKRFKDKTMVEIYQELKGNEGGTNDQS